MLQIKVFMCVGGSSHLMMLTISQLCLFTNALTTGAGRSIPSTVNSLTTEDTLSTDAHSPPANSIHGMSSRSNAMNMDTPRDTNPVSHASPMSNRLSSVISKAKEMHIDASNARECSIDNQSSNMDSNVAAAHIDTVNITPENSVGIECSPVVYNVETDTDGTPVATDTILHRTTCTALNTSDVQMVDALNHPLILSRDQEVPFTYIASLSVKWAKMKEEAPSVQGKIKVRC